MNKHLIYGLLLSILMVVAPHANHLPLWVSAACVIFLLWRFYLTYSGNPLPKRWLLMGITAAIMGGIVINFRSMLGREVGVTLLILLTTLKFLELRSPRDATVLIYLACFIIITNFFYSQSIPVALYMLVTLMVIMTTWVQLYAQDIALKPGLRIAATLLLQAVPLALVLFILFPRVGPLWGLPQDAYASSGLDDKMAPGSLSRLSLSDEVAFRVTYNGRIPLREQMYWRGPVLWHYDGRIWTPGKTSYAVAPQFTETEQPIDYSVTLEPHNKTWLFVLDVPNRISIPANLTYDFQVLQQTPVKTRLRYDARSYLGYHANRREVERQIQRGLQLPRPLNPKALQLAADWRAQAEAVAHTANITAGYPAQLPPEPFNGARGSERERQALIHETNLPVSGIDETIVRTALSYFNHQGFRYTLEPPALGHNEIDEFLFTTKQGFCEHYASAFTFLMRAAHIPAHVVTGYQGGEYNETGNYYIVRQSDAHAWVEVWLAGKGWVRIDPTAVIAPDRVQRSMSAAVMNNAGLPYMARNPPQWLRNLRLNWDTLANQWNQWVLGYNNERQFAFLTRLGMESLSLQKMALNMVVGIIMLVALFALFMLRHLLHQPDKVQAAWLKLCRRLAKADLARAAHEGARDYAARVAAARPELAPGIHELAARYNALRYEGQVNKLKVQEFIRLAAKFRFSCHKGGRYQGQQQMQR